MKTSLKDQLLMATKRFYPGAMPLEAVEALCHMTGRKVDNASRRLRELMATGVIEAIRKNGAIIGYKYANHLTTEQIGANNGHIQQQMFNTRIRA